MFVASFSLNCPHVIACVQWVTHLSCFKSMTLKFGLETDLERTGTVLCSASAARLIQAGRSLHKGGGLGDSRPRYVTKGSSRTMVVRLFEVRF